MDAFETAYAAGHAELGHSVQYLPSVADLAGVPLPPDVVVINPLVTTPEGIDGACAVQALVPPTTVIVAIFTNIGSSHSMFTRHALGGRCHSRMLLHYPSYHLEAANIVAEMDSLARSSNDTDQIRSTGHLPSSLTDHDDLKDLGQILTENAEHCRSAADSLTFARLLYAAATNTQWSTWGDLAAELGFAEGHVKNTKARIGHILTEEVLPDKADVGVPSKRAAASQASTTRGSRAAAKRTPAWRIAEFTRFVTEHRSFIRAYCAHHLGAELQPTSVG